MLTTVLPILSLLVMTLDPVYGRMKPLTFPYSFTECIDHLITDSFYKHEPSETTFLACLSKYSWEKVGQSWYKADSSSTWKTVEDLLKPTCEKIYKNSDRHKRSTTRPLRVRKEYRSLTDKEREDFHKACNMLKEDKSKYPNIYDGIAKFHEDSLGSQAHGGPAFLPWHRMYLLMFEEALRRKIPTVTIPFWDSTLDSNLETDDKFTDPRNSIMWSEKFAGNGNGFVENGPYKWRVPNGTFLIRNYGSSFGRLLYDKRVQDVLSANTSNQLHSALEGIHNLVHVWVGGVMSELATAALDPVFFMHHCFIDYLWWNWQRKTGKPEAYKYPDNFFASGNHNASKSLFNITLGNETIEISNAEGYGERYANEFFTYEASPTCSVTNNISCNSPYLKCLPAAPGGGHDWEYGYFDLEERCAAKARTTNLVKEEPNSHSFWKRDTYHEHFHYNPQPLWQENVHSRNHGAISGKSPLGYSVQNNFKIDCIYDHTRWAYLPIKIIHKRYFGKSYNSYPIRGSHVDYSRDIYSSWSMRGRQKYYSKPQHCASFMNCREDESGMFRISISSNGFSYRGQYNDYVLLDNRQMIDSKVTYIGFRKPDRTASKVLFTAFDHCGRICRPKCLVPGSNPPVYRSCSGLLRINKWAPRYYGSTYDSAVRRYWGFRRRGGCPREKDGNVFLVFYCDYRAKWWPWIGCKRG